MSSLGDAKSSLGDAKSSLGDAESLLGDAKRSLSHTALAVAAAHGHPPVVDLLLHTGAHPAVWLNSRVCELSFGGNINASA
jgi:ankyrin repeat protein